ncbi:MAG: methionine biosynthesis protein MetW [Candidatus Absconditabacteria bacterium]
MLIELISYIGLWISFLVITILFIVTFYVNVGLFMGTVRAKGVPYVGTMKGEINILKNHLKMKPGTKLIDLGCGDGKVLRLLVGSQGLNKGIGYDLNHIAVLWGKIINKYKKINNIEIKYNNFLKANLKEFDYIYIYLFPKHMAMYEDWIFENMGDNAVIIANTFPFEKRKPFQMLLNDKGKERIFLYKKNN